MGILPYRVSYNIIIERSDGMYTVLGFVLGVLIGMVIVGLIIGK